MSWCVFYNYSCYWFLVMFIKIQETKKHSFSIYSIQLKNYQILKKIFLTIFRICSTYLSKESYREHSCEWISRFQATHIPAEESSTDKLASAQKHSTQTNALAAGRHSSCTKYTPLLLQKPWSLSCQIWLF